MSNSRTIRIPNGWQPRWYQRALWDHLEAGGKRALMVAHRRWGKDEVALHRSAVAMIERPATYWHMLPEYGQGRKAIWNAVNPHSGKRRIDEAFPHEIRNRSNDNEMFIELINGATWQVVGSDSYDSVVGSPPVGVTFSEWALADPRAWAYIQPILSENDGWALFITTPRGKNHVERMVRGHDKDPNWYVGIQTVDDTHAISREAVDEARKGYRALFGDDQGDMLIEQEYYCSFDAAVIGAYYGRQMAQALRERRICGVPHDPAAPVWTAWDLGMDDATAIWFVQCVGREFHAIDYYEATGMDLAHYVKLVKDKPYLYGGHILPHDVKARELGTGKSREEVLKTLGLAVTVCPDHRVDDGINALRLMLPKLWFDQEKCARGIEALSLYRADYDEKNQVLKPKPVHDWASHPADALRYLAIGIGDAPDAPVGLQNWQMPKRVVA
ncbi:hypothetical protein [Phreatobacter stygius]|uniref:Terminase n=1 Tax=Phreatobacter stygius TaxID=1940610 RepID=A0A4D7B9F0_9HYPH|nr:hypothetical protein [Phreatobacter stygius]QCI67515.1 hypothetical protein E8M01_26805 [Phreatobacter stygius]